MNTGIDWGFWATIVGTIATLVFGVWAVIVAKKQLSDPGQIEYYDEPPIELFNDIARNLEHLKITYRDRPMVQNLVVIRGYLLNTGIKDIGPEMIAEPMTFSLKEGYAFLEAKLTSPSVRNVGVTIDSPQKLVIAFGLFKREEFIRFEALVESTTAKKMVVSLKIFHRITDTSVKSKGLLPTRITKTKNPLKTIEKYLEFLILGGIFVQFFGYSFSDHKREFPAILSAILVVIWSSFLLLSRLLKTKSKRIWGIIDRFPK